MTKTYAKVLRYRLSPKGCLMRAHQMASRRIKEGRGLYEGMTICSKEEFYAAFENDPTFLRLHALWVQSGHTKGQRPTPDRQDTSRGYLVDNIVWETYNINTLRALPRGNTNAECSSN